jgi:hypothetical protein
MSIDREKLKAAIIAGRRATPCGDQSADIERSQNSDRTAS